MKKSDSHNIMTFPKISDTQLDFIDVANVVMKREQTAGTIDMKVNYRRTVEKQRQKMSEEKQKERKRMLDSMSYEEREKFLKEENKRVKHALMTMGFAQAMLSDSPYSKLQEIDMDKRKYIAQLHTLETLPLLGTILYPPCNKEGNKLLRYEILEDDILAVVETGLCAIEMYWALKQVKQCTWEKMK